MENLKKIKALVKKELENNPVTRKSDMLLYLGVCRRLGIAVSDSFDKLVFSNKLPSYESVRRARQKLQAEFPTLKDDLTDERRKALIDDYRAFAK